MSSHETNKRLLLASNIFSELLCISSVEEEPELSVAEMKEKKMFENKRKAHYNMKEQMLRARQLMEEEDEDDG